MFKNIIPMGSIALLSLLAIQSVSGADRIRNRGSHYEHNFNNGRIWPFVQETTRSPSRSFVKNKEVRCEWNQRAVNGSRAGLGAEIQDVDDSNFSGRMYVGFRWKIPKNRSDNGRSGYGHFPNDKTQIIAQVMQNDPGDQSSTWTMVFEVRNNDLYVVKRNGRTRNHEIVQRIDRNISRDVWHTIEYQFNPDPDGTRGTLQVFYNGDLKIDRVNNIQFGFGPAKRHIKFGLYCFDEPNHDRDEIRRALYDNVSVLQRNNSRGGFRIVNPN